MWFDWWSNHWQVELHPSLRLPVQRKVERVRGCRKGLLYCWFNPRGGKKVMVVRDNGLMWAIIAGLSEKHNRKEITYTVKAFDEYGEIVNEFSSHDDALENFDEHMNKGHPSYLLKGSEIINSYDPTYDDYLQQAEEKNRCVYCGGQAGGGYCWQSPNGEHCANE